MHEQEDLPFFLLYISFAIIATKTTATIITPIVVGKFINILLWHIFYFLLGAGRNTKNTRIANTIAAKDVPIISPPPANHEPN